MAKSWAFWAAAAALLGVSGAFTFQLFHFRAEQRAKLAHSSPKAPKTATELLNQIKSPADAEQAGPQDKIYGETFFIWAALWLGTFYFIRAATRQQREVRKVKQHGQRMEAAYQRVADNLPIGFFTYSNGHVDYTNTTWDIQSGRTGKQDRYDALVESLHADDRERVLDTLRSCERRRLPYQIQYRVVAANGEIRYMESRGVPVSASTATSEGLLGFVLDVSASVLARQELEIKNAEVERTNHRLREVLKDLEDNLEATIQTLVKAVEAKDPYTAGHSERVMAYSVRIGQAMGLSSADLRTLEIGTLVHDVGKIGVPDAILTKPARLTDEEMLIVQQHPVVGARMVQSIPFFEKAIPIILYHHERLDGSGYPNGLKGEELSQLVRISAVADSFDAMTSTRAYRKGLSADQAIGALREDVANGKVDGKIVDALADIVQVEGVLWSEPNLAAA